MFYYAAFDAKMHDVHDFVKQNYKYKSYRRQRNLKSKGKDIENDKKYL